MQTVDIPGTYLELAKAEGVPIEIAAEAYRTRLNRKPVLFLGDALARAEGHDDVRECRRRLRRIWQNWIYANSGQMVVHEDKSLSEMAFPAQPDVPTRINYADYLEKAHQAFQSVVGQTATVRKNTQPLSNHRKVLGGDLHGLFVNPAAFDAFCSDPAEEAWIMGDISDMYASSRYGTTIDHITTRRELAQARMLMERISSSFKVVKVIPGNHDKRPLRRLQELLPQLLPLIVNPVELFIKGLDNVEMLSYKVPDTAPVDEMMEPFGEDVELDFLGLIGDVAIGHFEGFYGKDAPTKMDRWLSDWSEILKLERTPRIIAQAHTHRLSSEVTPKGRVILGTGCLCRAQAYQFDGHNKYQPPVTGYISLYQDENGVTNPQSIQLVPFC
mgnify:CR=1 FL=1